MNVPGDLLPNRRGAAFTLIELLVVVAVLAILFEYLLRAHARPVPHLEVAVGLWLLLTCVLPVLARGWFFAYFFGVALTAGLLSYCMHYRGFEFDGGLRALLGGSCTIAVFYFYEWVRGSRRRPQSPNPTLQRTPGSASASNSDVSGPAPLS
jgi:prepilin-type N-terminal cleavage/methylation domain-containing protein